VQERELEKALTTHIKKFLLELGKGFAYVGNQHNLNVKGDDYFLDLLFYNTHLHCYVVVELKVGEFKPEYAGKLNFYINTVDAQIKGKQDAPTIGVLLCKTENETVVKYALQGIKTPIGVADYKFTKALTEALPKKLASELPSVAELEKELEEEVEKLQRPLDKKLDKLKSLLKGLKEEEVKEKRSYEKLLKIFDKVIIKLIALIKSELSKDVGPLFESIDIITGIDSYGNKSITEARKYLVEHKGCYQFKMDIEARGFKKAGTKAFDSTSRMTIRLDQYKYSITPQIHNQPEVWVEKMYHQLPEPGELRMVAEKMVEKLVDDISAQIEYITKEKKK
jgi:hypothetical protein